MYLFVDIFGLSRSDKLVPRFIHFNFDLVPHIGSPTEQIADLLLFVILAS
jgi:hypothetical protein